MNNKNINEITADLSYVKSESFRFFAHDINNIFNNVRSSTELCKIFLADSSKINEVINQLNLIYGQIARGIKLVSNVRYLSMVSELSHEIGPFNIVKILDRAIRNVKKSFMDKKINIQLNSSSKKITLKVNELLSEVFENLLINSVLHNLKDPITITIDITGVLKDKKNYIKIQFLDNGIGISDNCKEWIFRNSFQKEKYGKGMGFGLTLIKEIIKSYGGLIWVEDRIKGDYSQGSNFTFLLPVEPG
ncbi:MAG: sensor histidine kinase [Candidatus Thorarchaeota archaeon]